MIFDCIIGDAPSGSPSGPMARLWISLTTKSGVTTLTSTPLRIEEADHGVFAAGISRAFGHAGEPGETGHGHDQSAGFFEVRQRERRETHRREIVHFHQPLEDGQILERVESAPHRDSGVVHDHVDSAEGLHGFRHQPFEILLAGDVGGYRQRLATPGAALLRK
jgi:hypothetical protein